MAKTIRATARAADGRVLVDSTLPGWYVLANGERRYEVPLSPGTCAALASLSGNAVTEDARVEAQARADPSECAP
jgi:fimbrial chaperone protein